MNLITKLIIKFLSLFTKFDPNAQLYRCHLCENMFTKNEIVIVHFHLGKRGDIVCRNCFQDRVILKK
jgi:hypothetical protein